MDFVWLHHFTKSKLTNTLGSVQFCLPKLMMKLYFIQDCKHNITATMLRLFVSPIQCQPPVSGSHILTMQSTISQHFHE